MSRGWHSSSLCPSQPSASRTPITSAPSSRLVGGGRPFARSRLVDQITCHIEAGAGGDGAVAFLREKFRAQGPPCGGNGGRGGSVYVQAAGGNGPSARNHLAKRSNLVGIARHVKAPAGKRGQGKGMDGRNGEDIFLTVPIGTIVRRTWIEGQEIGQRESPDQKDPDWVHYPGHEENNATRPEFIEAQKVLKEHLRDDQNRTLEETTTWDISAEHQSKPVLIARGGSGGLGNPSFLSATNRSPKYASRGRPGQSSRVELELRYLADVGLVGPPNVGKSTILRGLTKSQAKVGDWEFTTLEPNLGVLHRSSDGDQPGILIADIPGLLPGAAESGLGLGHDFLRHVARAKCLVFIVDLSKEPLPGTGDICGAVKQLTETWSEVEQWQEMQPINLDPDSQSKKQVLILANKADLVPEAPGRQALEDLQAALRNLGMASTFLGDRRDEIIALSAKQRVNLDIVARKMSELVAR